MAAIIPAFNTPKCDLCKTIFIKPEYMNTHMKLVHGESDHERLERLTQTLKSDANKNLIKSTSKVTFSEDMHTHDIKYHVNSDDSEDDNNENICDLCDNVLPNRTQKSNHMLFQHTVRKERLKCDYCGYMCSCVNI